MTRAGQREAAAAEVLLDVLPVDLSGQRILVVDDDTDRLALTLEVRGGHVTHWWRRALAGHAATAWPTAADPHDIALVRLSPARAALAMALHGAAAQLRPGGSLWLYGANDEGIKSARKPMAALLGEAEAVTARHHCRVFRATRHPHPPGLIDTLAGWRVERSLDLGAGPRLWVSYPGTFAKGGLDPATAGLLSVLPDIPEDARVLDWACGTGVIGAAVRARQPSVALDLLDVDAPSLQAATENVPAARRFLSDGWSRLPRGRYDLIFSNPPLHRGVARTHDPLESLVAEAANRLVQGGALWLVTQRPVPVQRTLTAHLGDARLAWEDGRFRVWWAPRLF